MTLLTLSRIVKRYGVAQALAGVGLSVARGSRTVIVGPSGSGKSTLLRIIAGFEAPAEGTVVLAGRTLASDGILVPAWQRGIGYVAQDGALFPHLTVADNIGFGLIDKGATREHRIAELMSLVDLPAALLTRLPDELSGGQQQRVAIARALAQRPLLMLLDEPFSSLDTGLREATREAVGRVLATAGVASVLVTHDQTEALSFADQVAVMRNGAIVQAGTPEEVYLRPVDEGVARYLGEALVLPSRLAEGAAETPLGRIAVGDRTATGEARILLRPEQITWNAGSGGGAGRATVVATRFSGARSSLVVRVEGTDLEVRLDCPPHLLPPLGSIVQLTVAGNAHVLA